MRNLFICTVVLLFIKKDIYAQHINAIDSLKLLIEPLKGDIQQINLLNKIAFLYSTTDSINTCLFANKAIEKSALIKYKPGLAKAYEAKGNSYLYKTYPHKAITFFESASNIWQFLNDQNSYANAQIYLAQSYHLLNKYSQAAELLQKAEKIYLKTNNKPGLNRIYHTMGSVCTDRGEKELAVDYFIRSLKIQEKTGDRSQIRSTENNLGRLLVEMKNYPEAIKYYNKSIQNSLSINDWRNLGITRVNMANIFITLADYPTGIKYLNKAIIDFEKVDFKRGIQTAYNNLGAINLRIGNYNEAIIHLNAALDIAKDNQAKSGVALIEQNIGYGYTGLKKYEQGLFWYAKAEATAQDYGADQYTFGEIYNHRASLDSAMNNYQSALIYRTKFVNTNEKLLNDKISKQVLEVQTKYETEKKELKINILSKSDSIKSLQIGNQQLALGKNLYLISQQNLSLLDASLHIANDSLEIAIKNEIILKNRIESTQKIKIIQDLDKQKQIQRLLLNNKSLEVSKKNTIIAAISIFTLLAMVAGYYWYKKRTLQQQAATKAAIAKKQEEATIAIITAEEKERKRMASDLHDGVGQLMTAAWLNLQAVNNTLAGQDTPHTQLINKTMLLVNESMKEVRAVSHNMMPNALLKKGLVNAVKEFIHQLDAKIISINVEAEGLQKPLNSHTETILYRVIQESVNNVIKHAAASQLDISINNDIKGIDVLIEDNGKGFDVLAALNIENGLGLRNIQSRILYLNGTVQWDSSPGNGTVVAIHIPLSSR